MSVNYHQDTPGWGPWEEHLAQLHEEKWKFEPIVSKATVCVLCHYQLLEAPFLHKGKKKTKQPPPQLLSSCL